MKKNQHHRLMTDAEEEILRQRYPNGGPKACMPELGKYTRHQIHNRAYKLGIRMTDAAKRELRHLPKEYAWKEVDAQAFVIHRQAEELMRAWR